MREGISVIICCYNSANRLPETIKHLAVQKFNKPWQLIIVNNASTDNTRSVAENEWRKYEIPFAELTIVDEWQPGLSSARKRGVAEAVFKLSIFCDDDNWFDEDFLENAYQEMAKRPKVGILGAYAYQAVSDIELPGWFKDYSIYYAVGKQGGSVNENIFAVYGAGMVFRTELIKCIYENYTFFLSDRKGNLLISGGDIELCFAVNYLGIYVQKSEIIKFKHFIPSQRLNFNYLKRLFYGHGVTEPYFEIFKMLFEQKVPDPNFWKKKSAKALKNYIFSIITSKKWKMEGRHANAMYARLQISFNLSFLNALLIRNFAWKDEMTKIVMQLDALNGKIKPLIPTSTSK